MMILMMMMMIENALSGKFLWIIGLSANCLLDHMSFLAGDDDDDIYILMQLCLSVTKNHHFLFGVSCNQR